MNNNAYNALLLLSECQLRRLRLGAPSQVDPFNELIVLSSPASFDWTIVQFSLYTTRSHR